MDMFCIMTTFDLIWQQWNDLETKNQVSPWHSIQSRLAPSDYHIFRPLMMCYMDANLHTVKWSRMWCIHGFVCNQKHSLQMTPRAC